MNLRLVWCLGALAFVSLLGTSSAFARSAGMSRAESARAVAQNGLVQPRQRAGQIKHRCHFAGVSPTGEFYTSVSHLSCAAARKKAAATKYAGRSEGIGLIYICNNFDVPSVAVVGGSAEEFKNHSPDDFDCGEDHWPMEFHIPIVTRRGVEDCVVGFICEARFGGS